MFFLIAFIIYLSASKNFFFFAKLLLGLVKLYGEIYVNTMWRKEFLGEKLVRVQICESC